MTDTRPQTTTPVRPALPWLTTALFAATTIVFASLYGVEVSRGKGKDPPLTFVEAEAPEEDDDEDAGEKPDYSWSQGGKSTCFVSACINEEAECPVNQTIFTDGCSDYLERTSPYDVSLRHLLPFVGCPTDDKQTTIDMARALSEAANQAFEVAGTWFAVAIAADASDEFSKIYWEYEEVDKYGPYAWHEKEKKKPGVDTILDTLAEQQAMLEKVTGTLEPAAAEGSKVQKRRSRKLLTNDPQSLYLSANALDSYNAAMSSRDFAHKLVQWKNVIISDLEEVSDPDINFCETGLAYDRAFNSIELDIVAKSFQDAAAELRTIREGIRSQLTETAHSLCQFATLNFIEEKLDYNTLRESVSDGGVDTPRTATEFAALPNWHEDLWDQVEGQSENNAAIPNIGTDDPHPNTAITDEDVISGLNDLAYSYLNSSDFSLVMWNGFDRPGTNMKGSRHYFDHQSSVDFGNAVTVAHFMASRKVPYDLPRLQAQRSNATVYLNPIVCDDGAVVNLRKGLRFALDMAIERKHIINSLYRAAAKANETSVLRFMRTDKIRWLRGGDIDDQPEWGESLLMSNARRIEDMRKIIRTFVQVETFEGYADWYIDHQMPDTVP